MGVRLATIYRLAFGAGVTSFASSWKPLMPRA
jgi:hypothetical protein